jgi:hypothetical protein
LLIPARILSRLAVMQLFIDEMSLTGGADMQQLSIRERLLKDFGVNLQISGGLGNSLENAVVIQYGVPNDYVSIEYAYLKYLGFGRGIQWRVIQQELVQTDDKTYDKIKIETLQKDGDETIKQIENFYFDITECFGK